MMADENVLQLTRPTTSSPAVAGVLYFASAELDDYGASVSEETVDGGGCRPGNGCVSGSIG